MKDVLWSRVDRTCWWLGCGVWDMEDRDTSIFHLSKLEEWIFHWLWWERTVGRMFPDKKLESGFEHVKFERLIEPQGRCQVCECGNRKSGPRWRAWRRERGSPWEVWWLLPDFFRIFSLLLPSSSSTIKSLWTESLPLDDFQNVPF